MIKQITFNQLRAIKDALPDGSMQAIASELGISADTVRNYFGAQNYDNGDACGIHLEAGPDGGMVVFDDTKILDAALEILCFNGLLRL